MRLSQNANRTGDVRDSLLIMGRKQELIKKGNIKKAINEVAKMLWGRIKKTVLHYKPAGKLRGIIKPVPKRSFWILWWSLRIFSAREKMSHSALTFSRLRRRNRQKLRSSLIYANVPSAWIERFTRKSLPERVEIFFSIASRWS